MHLRDLIQSHAELSFTCAGSEVSLVREMLGADRAFFRMFELLHLGPMDPEHFARWIDSLRAVASGADQIFSSEVRRRFALPTSSTVASAVSALEGRGLLVRDAEAGDIRFDSPFVRLWVEWEALGDVPEAE